MHIKAHITHIMDQWASFWTHWTSQGPICNQKDPVAVFESSIALLGKKAYTGGLTGMDRDRCTDRQMDGHTDKWMDITL